MKKAYYVDTYSYGILHEMYDASSLKMFASIYDEIVYYADITAKEHLEVLLNGLPNNVTYQQISVPDRKTKAWRFLKQIKAMYNNCRCIIKAPLGTTVIINYNTMSAIYLVNFITKLTNKKVMIVCHGEMQALCIKQNTSNLFKLNQVFFTNIKTVLAKGLYFAVLGDIIKENLKPYLSEQVYHKTLSFDHTAIFNTIQLAGKDKTKGILQVGSVGIMRESKGLSLFLDLAKKLSVFQNQIQVSNIGIIDCDKQKIQESGIYMPKIFEAGFLSRQGMYQLIAQLDVVLFLYPKDGYKVTASGALFDAIDCERPILALKNDYLDYFFNKFGSVGCLVDTYEDLEKEIKLLLDGKTYDVDFKKIKLKLKSENIALSLKEKLNKIGL